MKNYTIGVYFNESLTEVVMILKNRPQWQAGNFNFPGGHVEQNESSSHCITREFNEECGVFVKESRWKHIGNIHGSDYIVYVFTAVKNELDIEAVTMEDEEVRWIKINELPENIISNLVWLVPYAKDFLTQKTSEHLSFSNFYYEEN